MTPGFRVAGDPGSDGQSVPRITERSYTVCMTEAAWAILAFLLGWKLAGGHPGSPGTAVKNSVHQAVTQASNSVLSAVWDVAWHAALILALLAALILAARYGVPALLRRAGISVTRR